MKLPVPFYLTSEDVSYLDTWMNKVSRSFAVVVSVLEEPLRYYLASAYIVCRVIDNIEDSTAAVEWKKERFVEITQLIEKPELAQDILKIWEVEAWPGLTQDEKKLMSSRDGALLWRIISQFPDEVGRILRDWTLQMVDGMSRLQEAATRPNFVRVDGIQVLQDEQDYNHYCYIVAGTVGHLATELVMFHYQLPEPVSNQLLQYCEACGRGLQKTNIIKDFTKDLMRGICYLPDKWLSEVRHTPLHLHGATRDWKRKVLVDVLSDLKDATEYALALPYKASGYRMSSLLCLLPALQTILHAAQNQGSLFTARHPTKISHQAFAQCVLDARKLTKNNQSIVEYYQQMENRMNVAFMGTIP